MNALRNVFLLATIVAVLAFGIGFWRFADSVRTAADPNIAHADGIVALTGGSLERLQTGVRLLKEGRGDRLLISGVNPSVADHELFSRIDVDDHLAQCCVDLGRSAEDTLGNASETARWAHRHHYKDLILVTDDYHMPRARTELSLALPEAKIHPYPVRTRWTDPALWRSDLSAASRLGGEYVKYLMIRTREALIKFSGEHKPASSEAPSHT